MTQWMNVQTSIDSGKKDKAEKGDIAKHVKTGWI